MQSQSSVATLPAPSQIKADKPTFSVTSLLEIIPKKAQILRQEGITQTKPSIFDDPQVLPRLAIAFCIGGTVEEAAYFAGCSASTIKKHIRERTSFQLTTAHGEVCIRTFDDLVNGWRVHITMLAKIKIYQQLLRPVEDTGTKDAWRILEAKEPEEYGRTCRLCARRA